MTAAQVLAVRRVDDDTTVCRRCDQPITRGRRVALVTGTGNVCLRCLPALTADTTKGHDTDAS